jgi:hypothetical protein
MIGIYQVILANEPMYILVKELHPVKFLFNQSESHHNRVRTYDDEVVYRMIMTREFQVVHSFGQLEQNPK